MFGLVAKGPLTRCAALNFLRVLVVAPFLTLDAIAAHRQRPRSHFVPAYALPSHYAFLKHSAGSHICCVPFVLDSPVLHYAQHSKPEDLTPFEWFLPYENGLREYLLPVLESMHSCTR